MNILIYRYNSICEDAVIRGLKELGHTVYEVILEVENKSPSGQEILDAVVMGMEKSNADIIFSINYYPALSEIARVYKLLYYSYIQRPLKTGATGYLYLTRSYTEKYQFTIHTISFIFL